MAVETDGYSCGNNPTPPDEIPAAQSGLQIEVGGKMLKTWWYRGHILVDLDDVLALRKECWPADVRHEVIEYLSWAIDLIAMYDMRLAAIDDPALVYSDIHKRGMNQARGLLDHLRKLERAQA